MKNSFSSMNCLSSFIRAKFILMQIFSCDWKLYLGCTLWLRPFSNKLTSGTVSLGSLSTLQSENFNWVN